MKVRISVVAIICYLLVAVSASVFAEQSPVSLGQVLGVAVGALTSSLPSDMVLNGSMQISAGGRSETATLTAAARGTAQSYEVISGQYTQSKLVFSQGEASMNGTATSPELACTAQSAIFPANLLSAIANDPNTAGEVVGTETIDGVLLLHFRTQKNFPEMYGNYLSFFTQRDWWLDPTSGLVRKLVFERRPTGSTAGIRYEYWYDAFQRYGGVLVPTSIRQAVNGTPYATITINSVLTNTGLTDQDFAVQ